MSKAPSDWKERLAIILKKNANDKCADCGSPNPDWGVFNIGVFVCIHCSGIHRQMGVDISKVRSTKHDDWLEPWLQSVESKGNSVINPTYIRHLPSWYITPAVFSTAKYRDHFITEKYQRKRWMDHRIDSSDEKKMDPAENRDEMDAPERTTMGVFILHGTKKKVILQLLGEFLHYFRAIQDSFSFERYNVTNLKTKVIWDDDDEEAILVIETPNETLFRCVSTKGLTEWRELIEFAHAIRRSTAFYKSSLARRGRAITLRTKPLDSVKASDITSGSQVLGYASKKGGGVRGYKKRWWVLLGGYLYYFKKDFRSKGGPGKPQGYLSLHGADCLMDRAKIRSKKKCLILLMTQDRTFYIVPGKDNAKSFFQTIENACLEFWPRVKVDFVRGAPY